MSTLTGTKISDTYVGLLKTLDTTPLSDLPKEISDGLGNGSGVKLDNAGNLDVTNTVAFGSLKDTSEDITITKFVDEADGIENNDDDTSIPTSAAVKDYVDDYITAQDLDFSGNTGTGDVDLDSEVFTITGSNGITTTALDNTLDIDGSTLQTAINTNTADISTNAGNITTNATNIATNETDIATNATNIASNDIDISTNAANIATNETAIESNRTDISTNATNIANNVTNISTNQSNIATNATNIGTNTAGINTNATNIATNTADIATNVTNIATNTATGSTNASNIATNTTAIGINTTGIATNVSNIATNATDIATNSTDIGANATAIATNTTDIATNVTSISTNTTAIATNATDISTNETDIATNAANIATNTATGSTNAGNIATNTTNIATNTTNIATNVTNIATNTADIATNVSAITNNSTDILSIENDVDANADDIADLQTDVATNTGQIAVNTQGVYFNGQNIATKVSKSGDTMTGNLTLGTNSLVIGGTAAANELDDYEEGTYNFAFTLFKYNTESVYGSSSFSSWTNSSTYVKVGRKVTLFINLSYTNPTPSAWNDASLNVGLGNLPFFPAQATGDLFPVGGTWSFDSNYQTNTQTNNAFVCMNGGYNNFSNFIALGGGIKNTYPNFNQYALRATELPDYAIYLDVGTKVKFRGVVTYYTNS